MGVFLCRRVRVFARESPGEACGFVPEEEHEVFVFVAFVVVVVVGKIISVSSNLNER